MMGALQLSRTVLDKFPDMLSAHLVGRLLPEIRHHDYIRCQFHQHVCHQSKAAFAHIFFDALMVMAFGENAPIYGAQCKNCSLKHAVKFQLKYC